MDVAQLGVGFLLGIIGAGFGVVLEQVVVGHFRDQRIRCALLAEIEENIVRIGPLDGTVAGFPGPVERSAWDDARSLSLPESVFDVVATAYALGAELNNRIAITDTHLAGGVPPYLQTLSARQPPAGISLLAHRRTSMRSARS